MHFNKKSSHKSGLFAEFLARWFLRFYGFKILKTRFITGKNTGRAEIDIIASRGRLMIFIEVKSRPNISLAMDSITPAQSERLRAAAHNYLSANKWWGDARFDIIAVCGLRVYHVRGAL